MTDARTRFFDNMERELLEQVGGSPSVELDFSISESGRTISSSRRRSTSNLDDFPCDSLRTLEDIREESNIPPPPASSSNFVGAHPSNLEEFPCDSLRSLDGVRDELKHHQQQQQQHQRLMPAPARPIPVPKPNGKVGGATSATSSAQVLPSSQPSSQGSSGSAFLNSVLNSQQDVPAYSSGNKPLSHTPPAISASYDHHFGKRLRSGSVSGRLRSASDLFDDKHLDRNTKLLLKDLILIGDEQVQEALDQFESTGDSSLLEQMIASGTLQHRVPADLDLLDDLDLDFLNVHEELPLMEPSHSHHLAQKQVEFSMGPGKAAAGSSSSMGEAPTPAPATAQSYRLFQSNMVSPLEDDDGIGDFEFNEFAEADYYAGGAGSASAATGGGGKHAPSGSRHASLGTSPQDTDVSEYERRMRSNSLFSALLNDKFSGSRDDGSAPHHARAQAAAAAPSHRQQPYPSWMDRYTDHPDGTESTGPRGIQINVGSRQQSASELEGGGIAASLLAAAAATSDNEDAFMMDEDDVDDDQEVDIDDGELEGGDDDEEEDVEGAEDQDDEDELEVAIKAPKAPKPKKVPGRRGRIPNKDKKKDLAAEEPPEERVHVPGSGLPRSLSDPNLVTSHDSLGLRHVERPDGWVGAYSPESRKVRIDRFLAKRNHRVWCKTIKYDVRKNFADSRLRVKGRFVRKEDELLMRELMSLT